MKYGKDFTLNPDGTLRFREGVVFPQPDVRTLKDALPYLAAEDPGLPPEKPLYYMYRGVYFRGDEEVFARFGVRYDITVLVAGELEGELIKTVGHFHPLKPGKEETYPEYYEVLFGKAAYLLQRNDSLGEAAEFTLVEAEEGEKVYIPPDFGHVTVNRGKTPLVMANLVAADFASLYAPFKEKRGALYYLFAEGEGYRLSPNPRYGAHPAPARKKAGELPPPVPPTLLREGLYRAFLSSPGSFRFLWD